jgi:hypothetical protein
MNHEVDVISSQCIEKRGLMVGWNWGPNQQLHFTLPLWQWLLVDIVSATQMHSLVLTNGPVAVEPLECLFASQIPTFAQSLTIRQQRINHVLELIGRTVGKHSHTRSQKFQRYSNNESPDYTTIRDENFNEHKAETPVVRG